jgi:S-DNA-T family DNA segregation ATPase FtsK/SpoIIIE
MMALSLAIYNRPRALQLVLIDPKRRGFGVLAALPHLLTPVIHRPEEADEVLTRLAQEMERRDLSGRSSPRIVVFIDELADLMIAGGRAIEQPLTRLAQRGREAGIHLVACTQRPAASVIGGLIKSNFPVRVVGSVASAEDAKVAAGLPRTGAERLLGRGDFLVIARGDKIRVQGAYAGAAEMRRIVSRIRASQGQSPGSARLGHRVAGVTRRLVHSLPAVAGRGPRVGS